MQGGEGSGSGTTGLGGCPRNETRPAANRDWARWEAVMNDWIMPTPFPSGLLPAEAPSVGEDERGLTLCGANLPCQVGTRPR